MAIYLTGRTRRLVITGLWQAPIQAEYFCTNEWPIFPNRYATISECWPQSIIVRGLGMKAEFVPLSTFGSWPANNVCSNSFSAQYQIQQSVTLGELRSFEQTASAQFTNNYTVSDGATVDIDPSATYAFWADVEECFEVVNPMPESDADGFPDYAGLAVADGLTARSIRFFERLRVGGEMGVSISGLAPVSLTRTIIGADVVEVGAIDYALDRRASIYVKNDLGIVTISGDVDNQTITADYHRSVVDASFDARPGFVLQVERDLNESGTAYGYSRALPETRVRWSCGLAAGSDWLDEPVTVALLRRAGSADSEVVTGRAVRDFDQRCWEAYCELDGVAQDAEAFDDRSAFRTWLPEDSRLALAIDPRDWRMMFRGRRWAPFLLAHADTILDDGTSLDGWSNSGGSLSILNGVRFLAASGSSLVRTFSPPIPTESYRYLRIEGELEASDPRLVDVTIGSKSWTVRLSPGALDHELDLCLPSQPNDTEDRQDSRYPLDTNGKVIDGPMWGVSELESLTISGLGTGDALTIKSIELVRKGPARLGSLPSFDRFIPVQDGSAPLGRVGLWSAVDGRISDLLDSGRNGSSPTWRTIADLAAEIPTRGGWIVSNPYDSGDGYHSSNLEAENLLGAGITAEDEILTLQTNAIFGENPGVSLAHALWDQVEIYPGAGNVWTPSGSFGTRTVLAIGKIVRAQAWGLVAQGTQPRSGRTVEFRDAHDELRGSDNTDSRGEFQTGLPGGTHGLNHRISTGSAQTTPFLPFMRFRHRWAIRVDDESGGVAFDWHPSGLSVRASAVGDGVRLAFLSNTKLAIPQEINTQFSAQACAIRFTLGHKLGLILVTAEDGKIVERESNDLGETWSMPVILENSGASFPALAIHPDGRRFTYWIKDGNVQGVVRDQSGSTLATVSAARTAVDESGLAVGTLDRPGGQVDIEILTVESGSLVSSISTDGSTFA